MTVGTEPLAVPQQPEPLRLGQGTATVTVTDSECRAPAGRRRVVTMRVTRGPGPAGGQRLGLGHLSLIIS